MLTQLVPGDVEALGRVLWRGIIARVTPAIEEAMAAERRAAEQAAATAANESSTDE